jgi:putative FmdB family regulatory protein
MPFYDYKCTECDNKINDYRKGISEAHPTTCPNCNKEGLIQSYDNHESIVQYKGKGWMKTDGKY